MDVDVPFADAEVEEVHLSRAPLIRVVCQVRHPPLVSLSGEEGEEAAIKFAKRIEKDYPVFNRTREGTFILTPDGVRQEPGGGYTWRVKSGNGKWQVSFAPGFIALDTTEYKGRSNFLKRLSSVLVEYFEEVKPPQVLRIGLRYTNRIHDEALLERLPDLVKPEVLGLAGVSLPDSVTTGHAVTQIQYELESGGRLLVNAAILPPGAVIDSTLPGIDKRSWTFDIDAFVEDANAFDPHALNDTFTALGQRAYRYFRWAVTDQFLTEFGGQL